MYFVSFKGATATVYDKKFVSLAVVIVGSWSFNSALRCAFSMPKDTIISLSDDYLLTVGVVNF